MAKAGRNRKKGQRFPNGQPARSRGEVRENVLVIARQQPHRRRYGEGYKSELAECELGRLKLDKLIHEPQYEAGVRYREIVLDMRRALDTPRATGTPMARMMANGTWATNVLAPERETELSEKARATYAEAYRALNLAGRDATMAVNDIAVWDCDRHQARGGITALRAGLTALARHFGLLGKNQTRG